MKDQETITSLQAKISSLEEKLSAGQQLLEEAYIPLVESAGEALYLVDKAGNYLFITNSMANQYDVPVKEVIGKNYGDFHGPEVTRIFAGRIAEVFATGTPLQDEHLDRFGKKFIYRNFYPIKSSRGEVTKVAVLGQDITNLKEAEAALRKSEDRYRDLVENSGNLIYTHDLEGRLLSANNAVEKLSGFPRSMLIGRNLRDLLDPKVRADYTSYLTTIRESGKSCGLMSVITAAGEKRVIEYNNTIRSEGVAAPVVRGIAHDVTDRLVAEKRLNDTLSLLTATLEAAASGILAVDRRGEILTCNSKFARMWHIPADIIAAKQINPVLAIACEQLIDKESFLAHRQEIMRLPESEFSDELLLKDGRIFERTSKPQRSGGEILGRVYSFTDITARKNSEERYRALVESAGEAVYTLDRECRYVFVTENLAARYRKSVADIIGKKYSDFHSPEESRVVAEKVAEVIAAGTHCHDEHLVRPGKYVLRYFYPIKAPGLGCEIALVGVLSQDITDRIKLEESLRESEERYRTIIENIEEGYYEVDLKGVYRFVNEAGVNIFGYSRSEILGSNSDKLTDGENRAKITELFKIVSASGYPSLGCEWEVLRKNGERRHVESSISPIRDAKGNATGYRGVIRDVTAKKKAEETIHHMAYHDFLTGLPNRFLFQDRLNMALAQARRQQGKIALVTLDLDRFKEINDTLGHDIGDVLLQKVGKRLTGLVREGDTVARMGGDEFTLLLQSINDNKDIAIIAIKVLEALREPFDCDEHELAITPSIGIAIYPDHGLAMSTVLKNADQAMYRAKKLRNRYYVYGQL